jgi:hypothetical protein
MSQKATNDNRMLWIRNLESLEADGEIGYVYEYEFLSEVYITGVLDYQNGAIRCGLLETEKDKNGLFRYLVSIQHSKLKEPSYNKNADGKGYYFKRGIIGEIIAMMSVFFQARFYLDAQYSGQLTASGLRMRQSHNFLYIPPVKEFYPRIFSKNKKRNFVNFKPFLELIRDIDVKNHFSLITAFYHYERALKEIAIDTEMLFIRLVSSVEVLAKKEDLPISNPLDQEDFDSLFNEADLKIEQKKQLESVLHVSKDGFINIYKSKQCFIEFVNKYSIGCLRGGNWKNKKLKIFRKDIPYILKNIYDARSGYLHRGESMHMKFQYAGFSKWDLDPSQGMIIDNRKFKKKYQLPDPDWFQNIVRYSIIGFVETLK